MEIQTTSKVETNKPDIIVRNKEEKKCTIVEITVLLDTNLHKAYKEKETKYINLLSKLQQLYKGYKFNIVVIGVGAMGAIPKPLEKNLRKLFPQEEDADILLQRLQKAAILGMVKICKTAMSM